MLKVKSIRKYDKSIFTMFNDTNVSSILSGEYSPLDSGGHQQAPGLPHPATLEIILAAEAALAQVSCHKAATKLWQSCPVSCPCSGKRTVLRRRGEEERRQRRRVTATLTVESSPRRAARRMMRRQGKIFCKNRVLS